jgi:hypothetical protein
MAKDVLHDRATSLLYLAAPSGASGGSNRKGRPVSLLSTNAELRKHKIAVWSIPALSAELPDGRRVKTCPNAGVCASLCYARSGTYRFSNVKAAHVRNLQYVLDDPAGWEAEMVAELGKPRHCNGWVRIHDAGDFFAAWYLEAWCRIAVARPDVSFYAYTKEVTMTREARAAGLVPPNFAILFSLGGKEDRLIDLDTERHADVFADMDALIDAGYADQSGDDRLAVLGPQRVGIPANNIRHLKKRQGSRSFGELQAEQDARRRSR